jgi:single-stranded-DNA-specific exonuclease
VIGKLGERIWRTRPLPDTDKVSRLSRSLGIHPVVASLSLQRFEGYGDEEIHRHLFGRLHDLPLPDSIGAILPATEILAEAVCSGVPIGLFGDYDVDGICATAIMVKFLRGCGAKIIPLIPHREEGYGLSERAVYDLHHQGVKILLTLDNGITAIREIHKAVQMGMEVIVADHHHFDPASLPPARAIVHPALGEPGEWSYLSGAGVAFALTIQLRRKLRAMGFFQGREEPNLREAVVLATLGTIADLVPLKGANRLIVREGLKTLNRLPGEKRYAGIQALIEVSAVKAGEVDEEAVAFYLAPRLNAAGRVEDARLALELLLCEEEETARNLAKRLDSLNHQRQRTEDQILKEALLLLERSRDQRERPILFLASPDWHVGVIGIVAGRIAQSFYRPTLLLKIEGDQARGSARSIPEVNLIEALRAGSAWAQVGGHRQAAGVRVPLTHLQKFRHSVEEHLLARYDFSSLKPTLLLDQELPTAEVDQRLVNDLELLGPFGIGHPRPLFVSESILPLDPYLIKNDHLQFYFRCGRMRRRAIAFRRPDLFDKTRGAVRMAYRPVKENYRGDLQIRFQVEDLQSQWI